MRAINISRDAMMEFTNNTSYVVISIINPDDPPVRLKNDPNRVDVLQLAFHDSDRHAPGVRLMDHQQGQELLAFVEKYEPLVDMFVVHCHAGIARSSAVAAAISLTHLNENDNRFFDNTIRKYDKHPFEEMGTVPNRWVYRLILNMHDRNLRKKGLIPNEG